MKEIFTQNDFDELLSQERAILSFNFGWSGPAVLGVQNLKATDKFFHNQKNLVEINFWFADMSDVNNLEHFLTEWLKKTLPLSNFGIVNNGYPLIIWFSFGQILNSEFRADILKTEGIIQKTVEYFNL